MTIRLRERHLHVERIELELDGMALDDARLLASDLPAALEALLGQGEHKAVAGATKRLLITPLRGRALVDAIAERLVEAISSADTGVPEESAWH